MFGGNGDDNDHAEGRTRWRLLIWLIFLLVDDPPRLALDALHVIASDAGARLSGDKRPSGGLFSKKKKLKKEARDHPNTALRRWWSTWATLTGCRQILRSKQKKAADGGRRSPSLRWTGAAPPLPLCLLVTGTREEAGVGVGGGYRRSD